MVPLPGWGEARQKGPGGKCPPLQEAGLPQLLCSVTFSTAFASLCSFLTLLSAVSAQPSSVNPGLWLLLPLSLPGWGWGPPAGPPTGAGGTPKQQKSPGLVEDEGLGRTSCSRLWVLLLHHFFNKSGQGLAGGKAFQAVLWVFLLLKFPRETFQGRAAELPWEIDHPESPENAGIPSIPPEPCRVFQGSFWHTSLAGPITSAWALPTLSFSPGAHRVRLCQQRTQT